MKKGHFIFELVIVGITVILAALAYYAYLNGGHGLSSDPIFFFYLWLIPLGIMQVIHSLIIAINYWKTLPIQRMIGIYWLLIGVDFLIFLLNSGSLYSERLETIGLPVLPLLLSFYLLLITYLHRSKAPVEPQS